MGRYFSLWLQFAKNSMIREMEFKGHFIMLIFVQVAWSLVNIVGVEVIFSQTQSIAGWSKGEVFLIFALYRIITAFNETLFSKNIFRLSFLINSGELDLFLTKPVNTLFLVLTRLFSISKLSQFIIGFMMLAYASILVPLTWNINLIIISVILVLSAVLIKLSIGMITVTPIFWLQKLHNISNLQTTLFTTARFPRQAFPSIMRHTLTFIIPILFIAAIPAEIILGKLPWFTVVFVSIFSAFLFLVMKRFFHYALHYYSSASS